MPMHDWTRIQAGICHAFRHHYFRHRALAQRGLALTVRGSVETIASGERLPAMPLFIKPGVHVPVELL